MDATGDLKYPNIFGTTYSFMVTDFPDIIIQPSYDIFFVNLCSPPSPSYKQITKGLFGRFSIFSKQRWSKIHSTWMATRGKLASPLMLNNISLQCHVLYRLALRNLLHRCSIRHHIVSWGS
uniref:Uncharacterized protein n=1 Tax=Oryza glumipatula TaxID=40148 RepID=A0A0D9ZJJ8_9ORYZ